MERNAFHKISQIHIADCDSPRMLSADMAGEFPIYIYFQKGSKNLYFSKSIKSLLDSSYVEKPLPISRIGISFLLQSGVVPPPNTIYENIFILSIGNKAKIKKSADQLHLTFEYEFPFHRRKNEGHEIQVPQEACILELLADATISRLEASKPSYLFHSAGKDSNMIALALAEAGWQDKVTSFTYEASGANNENPITKRIAQKLGFSHKSMKVPALFRKEHFESIEKHFVESPLPCADIAALLFPLLMVELQSINMIDGMGNDVYMGHIPPANELKRQKCWKIFECGSWAFDRVHSENIFHALKKTRAEWCGLSGFGKADLNKILQSPQDCRSFWREKSKNAADMDYIEFRALIRGATIDTEVFIRKVRNAMDVYGWDLVLPWANQSVAEYFLGVPEELLFERKTLRNKVLLRKILKNRIGLDCDAVGKMPYGFDFAKVLFCLEARVYDEILNCRFWNKGVVSVLNRLSISAATSGRRKEVANLLIYRLYIVSAWLNWNKYSNH